MAALLVRLRVGRPRVLYTGIPDRPAYTRPAPASPGVPFLGVPLALVVISGPCILRTSQQTRPAWVPIDFFLMQFYSGCTIKRNRNKSASQTTGPVKTQGRRALLAALLSCSIRPHRNPGRRSFFLAALALVPDAVVVSVDSSVAVVSDVIMIRDRLIVFLILLYQGQG